MFDFFLLIIFIYCCFLENFDIYEIFYLSRNIVKFYFICIWL